jgi:hypothetical protein
MVTEAQPASYRIGAISDSLRVRLEGVANARTRVHAMDIGAEIVGFRPMSMKTAKSPHGVLSVTPGDQFYPINESDDPTPTEAAAWMVSNGSPNEVLWHAELDGGGFAFLHEDVPTESVVISPEGSVRIPVMLLPAAFDEEDFPAGGDYQATLTVVDDTSGERIEVTLTLIVSAAPSELVITPEAVHFCEGTEEDEGSFVNWEVVYTIANEGTGTIHVGVEEVIGTLVCWNLTGLDMDGFDLPGGQAVQFTSFFNKRCASEQSPGTYQGHLEFTGGQGGAILRFFELHVLASGGNGGGLTEPTKAHGPPVQQPPFFPPGAPK